MSDLKTIKIWDDCKMPHDVGDGYVPTLDFYLLPGDEVRPVVLVCPGGGYAGRAAHEGKDIALKFNSFGFHAFVVQYRVKPSRYPAGLSDVSRVIRIVRKNAKEWKIRPDAIAVCGFSAGGHLTASSGVFYGRPEVSEGDPLKDISNRPDACILCYPVISSGEFRHSGSFKNLLGEEKEEQLRDQHSAETFVTKETPPTFVWHTVEDAAVPVENAFLFAQALRKNGVPFELHVFPKGKHGLGLAPNDPSVSQWPGLCQQWLKGIFNIS